MNMDKATETPQQPDPLLGLGLSEGLGHAACWRRTCLFIRLRDTSLVAVGDRRYGMAAKRAAVFCVLVLKYAYAVFRKALYAR